MLLCVPAGASAARKHHVAPTLKACRAGDTRACVQHVIDKTRTTGEERVWLLEIPGCESTWSAVAYYPSLRATTPALKQFAIANDRSAGLYAFKPSTWRSLPSWLSRHSIWSPLWNTWAAWWLYRHDGDGREWSCTSTLGLT